MKLVFFDTPEHTISRYSPGFGPKVKVLFCYKERLVSYYKNHVDFKHTTHSEALIIGVKEVPWT